MTDLRPMPDHGGTVLWKPGHDVDYAVDHHDSGRPGWLVDRLDRWAEAFGRTRHSGAGMADGCRSDTERDAFLREARALRAALALARPDCRVIFRVSDTP